MVMAFEVKATPVASVAQLVKAYWTPLVPGEVVELRVAVAVVPALYHPDPVTVP